MSKPLKIGVHMKKEENSLEWIRHVRKKISKKLLSLPNNEERVRYIKNKAISSKRHMTILNTSKRKVS